MQANVLLRKALLSRDWAGRREEPHGLTAEALRGWPPPSEKGMVDKQPLVCHDMVNVLEHGIGPFPSRRPSRRRKGWFCTFYAALAIGPRAVVLFWEGVRALRKRKRAILWCAVAVVLLLCLAPEKRYYKDGGTVAYRAVLYQVTQWHAMVEVSGNVEVTQEGLQVEVLGWTVYDGRHLVEARYCG